MADAPDGVPIQDSDVTEAFERALSEEELRVLPAWRRQAWTVLRGTDGLRNVALRLAAEEADTDLPAGERPLLDAVRQVLIAMVERKLRNPDGLRSFGVDDGTQVVDAVLSTGQLYVTAEERARLLPTAAAGIPLGGGAYSIPLGR